MTNTVHDLAHSLIDIIYPLRCGSCGSRGQVLCADCSRSFRQVEAASVCPRCGRWTGQPIICGECITGKRGFEEGYYGFYFEDKLREAIHSFKFGGRKDVGRKLVGLLPEKVTALSGLVDYIVPMPVSMKRLKERGFNQSYIIAEELSRKMGTPVLHSALCKVKETRDQYTLSKEERRKNVKDAFAVTDVGSVRGKRLLLVDDLFTTGHTAAEAARALSRSGVREVRFFALARTP